MSRRNRNNNRYNNRNRNKWDEGYDDDYFDEDEQESEEEDSSDEQDEYEDDEYEEYESDEEYDEDESDDEYEDEDESEDEEYDEEYDEDESDDEEYEEDESEEDYEEDDSDDEDIEEEEEDEEDEDEEDELDSEIEAAAESTAKKSIGNSDLLSKLRGQMRPQLKEESSESKKDIEINVSPLSLFGQPIVQNGQKDNSKSGSSVPPQHANARIVQTATVGSKPSQTASNASVQKSGSGRVITAQSQNGASVTSVQPRDLEAEKAEAVRKQKERERQEEERKEKEEKSNRVLDKFKGKNSSAGEKTKEGAVWLWSKISSGAVWIWAGSAACFLWVVLTPKRAWTSWRIFNRDWWSGIGSGVWNTVKKPFVNEPSAVAQSEGDDAVPSGSAPTPASSEPALTAASRKRKSRKKNVDIWDAEATAGAETDAGADAFVSKEPDSRRRLYWSLSSIGAAAVASLLVLPSLMSGIKKNDGNTVAVNEQENVSVDRQSSADGQEKVIDLSESNLVSSDSNGASPIMANPDLTNPVSNTNSSDMRSQGLNGRTPDMKNPGFNGRTPDMRNPGLNGRTPDMRNPGFNGRTPDMRNQGSGPRSGSDRGSFGQPMQRPVSPDVSDGYRSPAAVNNPGTYGGNEPIVPPSVSDDLTLPSIDDDASGAVEPDMTVPEIPTPEVEELDITVPDVAEPELPEPEVTTLEPQEIDIPAPEASVDDIPVPEASTDDVPVPSDVETDVPVPEIPELEVDNGDNQSTDLLTPASPAEDNNASSDTLNVSSPDVPEDSAVDLTADSNAAPEEPDASVPEVPDLTLAEEPSDVPVDLPTPEADVQDVTMPELPESEAADANPIETPTAPEPSIPEPTELKSIDTDVAEQPAEPSEPSLSPEDNLPNDAQVASNSPEETPTVPEESAVALGTPGPLVSSAQGNMQEAAGSSDSPSANLTSLATRNSQLATTNNGYVYNSSGVYIVQPNDSFWTIAKRIYGSGEYARALAQYNSSRVSPQSLTVSTQIMTPPPETLEQQFPELCPIRKTASSASPVSVGSVPAGTRVYIVDQEESVMEIARRELGSILYCSQVYSLNQQQLSGSVDRVKPGVRLLLPVKN